MDEVLLQARVEALHRRVVNAVAAASHRDVSTAPVDVPASIR